MRRQILLATWLVFAPATGALASHYSTPGPYGVGVESAVFVDHARSTMPYGTYDGSDVRTLDVEIWYPANTGQGLTEVRDAPIAGGTFPLVVRAHGLGGRRRDAVYLTAFLASYGYIVVAPDFPLSRLDTPALIPTYFDIAEQPRDLSYLIDVLLGYDPLRGHIDPARIGSLGHSLGGLTVLLQGYDNELRDARVRAVAALAPWACSLQEDFFDGSSVPSLWMGATADLITPFEENQQEPFERAGAPRTLVTLEDATHINFSTASFDLDEDENPDDAYCSGTFGLLGLRPLPTPKLPSSLGDPPEIDRSTCGKICPGFEGDFMSDERQHELTRAAVLAFFEAELRGSQSAYDRLAVVLDAEPDVETTVVEGACAFGSCEVAGQCTSCGQPVSRNAGAPVAADALSVLRSAVAAAPACALCVCDVDADGEVDATDSLLVLNRATGVEAALSCLRAPA